MNATKYNKFEELAIQMSRDIEAVPSANQYKNLLNSFKSQIQTNQDEMRMSNISLRIFSELESGTIELRTLNAITKGLQSVFSSAINNLFGNGRDRGKIPNYIINQSRLVLTGVRPGSFIIELENIENLDKDNQLKILEETNEKNDILTDLLVLLNSDQDDKSIEQVIEEYGIRTFNISRDWFNDMEHEAVSFEYIDDKNNKKEIFDNQRIQKISNRLSNIRVSKRDEVLTLKGKLIGINNTKRLLTFEDDKGVEIMVKVSDKSLEKHSITTNKIYTIQVNKITIEDTLGKKSKRYQIETIDDTDLFDKE